MAVYNNDLAYRVARNLVAYLNNLNRVTGGLTDAVIAAITSSGTVAKLKTAIAGLTLRTQDQFIQREIPAIIDRAVRLGVLTDANVETARAAGTFAALITAVLSNSQAASVSTKEQVHVPWAG